MSRFKIPEHSIYPCQIRDNIGNLLCLIISKSSYDERPGMIFLMKKAISKMWLTCKSTRMQLVRSIYFNFETDEDLCYYQDDFCEVIRENEDLGRARCIKYEIDEIVKMLEDKEKDAAMKKEHVVEPSVD
jgi:hypothetical protein